MGFKKGSFIKYHREIRETFPEAKFIIQIRDGRAVFNSKKRSIYSATGKPFVENPEKAAEEWCEMDEWICRVTDLFPETKIIHYERLVSETEETVRNILNFLGMDYISETQGNEYHVSERYGNLHQNIKKESLVERISAWEHQLSRDEILRFENLAHPVLTKRGYELKYYSST